jgi:hypothetical protein
MSGTSTRTLVRDAVAGTLTGRIDTQGPRIPLYDVALNFLAFEECKRFPTYCVVVTDDVPQAFTQEQREYQLTVVIVILVKHERDVRAVLDAAIEDVYDAVLMAQQSLAGVSWKMMPESMTADEGATATKPHAQCIQRWSCSHARALR